MNEFRTDVELKTIGPADAVQAITWNFRGQLFTAPARGTAAEVREAFRMTPIRQIQGEAIIRSSAPVDWRVESVELRQVPGLVRLVSVEAGGGCILFENPEARQALSKNKALFALRVDKLSSKR